jgi:hypothetical protein
MFDGVAYHQHNCEFEQVMMGMIKKNLFGTDIIYHIYMIISSS